MSDCTEITLGGITFGDCDDVDANGIVWTWTRLDGWESPEVFADMLEPAGMDGEILGEWRHRNRAIVLAGVAHGELGSGFTPQQYWHALNTLSAAVNLVGGAGTLVVGEPTPKQATVKRAGRLRARPFRGQMAAMEFEVPLVSGDWRKYGTTLNADTSSPVNNAGVVRSTPVVTITGASTNPRITNATDDSKFVEVTTSLGGGQTLVLDMQNRTATHSVDGNVDDLIVAGSRWWDLLPGDNTISLSGGGSFSVSYRDAYV